MPSREFKEFLIQAGISAIDPRKGLAELRRDFDNMGLAFAPPGDASFLQGDTDGVKAEWTRVPPPGARRGLGPMLVIRGVGIAYVERAYSASGLPAIFSAGQSWLKPTESRTQPTGTIRQLRPAYP